MSEAKLEEILDGEKPGVVKPPAGQPALKTALEQELEGEDSELAKELQRSRAEEIITRRRVTIDRMRGGQTPEDTGRSKTPERGKEWLTDIAQSLLDRGLDQRVVGDLIDHLLGTARAPLVGLPGAPAPAQGMTFTDMMAFYKMVQESNKSDPTIAALLAKLTDKVQAIETKTNAPPPAPVDLVTQATQQAQAVKALVTNLAEAGLVQLPGQGPATGKPVELVKEENRHAEEMEKIRIDETLKAKVGEAVSDIPAALGDFAAERARTSGASAPVPSRKPATGKQAAEQPSEYARCTKCGAQIPIYADTNKDVVCPNCGPLVRDVGETPQ